MDLNVEKPEEQQILSDVKEQLQSNNQQITQSQGTSDVKKVSVMACLDDEEVVAPVQVSLSQPEQKSEQAAPTKKKRRVMLTESQTVVVQYDQQENDTGKIAADSQPQKKPMASSFSGTFADQAPVATGFSGSFAKDAPQMVSGFSGSFANTMQGRPQPSTSQMRKMLEEKQKEEERKKEEEQLAKARERIFCTSSVEDEEKQKKEDARAQMFCTSSVEEEEKQRKEDSRSQMFATSNIEDAQKTETKKEESEEVQIDTMVNNESEETKEESKQEDDLVKTTVGTNQPAKKEAGQPKRPEPNTETVRRAQPRGRILEEADKPSDKHRYWPQNDSSNLMHQMKKFQESEPKECMKFMVRGNALIEYAEIDDIDGFMKTFAQIVENRSQRNLVFWHIQQVFKISLRNKCLEIVEHLVEDLDLTIDHECFKDVFHMFLYTCVMAEQIGDDDMREVNRQLVRYLCRAARNSIDYMDNNSSTVLQICCDLLKDPVMVEAIIQQGADVNCVNNDNDMPLRTIIERRKKDPDSEELEDIEIMLTQKGAMQFWRSNMSVVAK